jgi:PAS domain S-box-containing protein
MELGARVNPRIAFRLAVGLAVVVFGGHAAVLTAMRNDPAMRALANDALFTLEALLVAGVLAGAAYAARRFSRRWVFAWSALAAAEFLLALGKAVWTWMAVQAGSVPYSSLADPAHLLSFPCFIVGLLLLTEARATAAEWITLLLDTAIVITVAVLVYWMFFFGHLMAAGMRESMTFSPAIAHPLGDLFLLWAALAMMFRPWHALSATPLLLLGGGVVAQIVPDAFFSYQSLQGSYIAGTPQDLFWVASCLMIALAGVWQLLGAPARAVSPAPAPPAANRIQGPNRWSLYLPYLVIGTAYVLLVWRRAHPWAFDPTVFQFIIGVILGLVLIRQIIALRENRRLHVHLVRELEERQRISNALRAAQAGLEERVKERTAELTEANRKLQIAIAEYTRADEQRRESERFFTSIFNSIQDGISILDTDFRIVRANPVMERRYAAAMPLTGKRCFEVYHQRQEPCQACPTRQTLQTGKAASETIPRIMNGETIGWYELHSFPRIDAGTGRMIGVIEYVRDITERRQAEDDRRRLEAHLVKLQKLESLEMLAGGIAHDFNNLLHAILGNVSLAMEEIPKDNPTQELLKEIERSGLKAADLSRQMLAYSGRSRFVVARLDLNAMLRAMLRSVSTSIPPTITLEFSIADKPLSIEGDAELIRQVVSNLVTNSKEAIANAPGHITVSSGKEHLTRDDFRASFLDDDQPEGEYAYLRVTDDGCGMNSATLTRIFDPFFTTKFVGRGLGLAVVLGVVRAHKGTLRVTSSPGAGAIFTVYLPVTIPVLAVEPPQAAAAAPAVPKRSTGGAILIVDDDEGILRVAKRVLEKNGYDILTATDGRMGCDLFRRHASELSAVVLDLTLPQMNGDDVFDEIHRLRPEIPVILMTGFDAENAKVKFAGRPWAGFLQKPFELSALVETVARTLSAQQRPNARPDRGA